MKKRAPTGARVLNVSEGCGTPSLTISAAEHQDLISFYRGCVAQAMLAEITAYPLDAMFDSLAHELAGFLGVRVSEAADYLRPVCHAVLQAAEEAADG